MTGSEGGDFNPHPGDPWHPEFTEGDASDDETADRGSEASEISQDQPRRKKGKKRRGRRKRRADEEASGEEDFEPSTTAFDRTEEPESESADDRGDDPFEAVLEREGRAQRLRDYEGDAPPPAWTIDQEPDPDQKLPIEQPSWVGRTTESAPGVEAVGFEPVDKTEGDLPSDDLDLSSAESAEDLPAAVEPDVAGDDAMPLVAQTAEDDDSEPVEEQGPDVVGEYGVAGPDAFDALEDDSATTGELDAWDAFMEGTGAAGGLAAGPGDMGHLESAAEPASGSEGDELVVSDDRRDEHATDEGAVGHVVGDEAAHVSEDPQPPEAGVVDDGLPDVEAFDEWTSSEPKKRRRFFGRRKREQAESPAEEEVWDAEEAEAGIEPYSGGDVDPPPSAEEGVELADDIEGPIGETIFEPTEESDIEAAVAGVLEALGADAGEVSMDADDAALVHEADIGEPSIELPTGDGEEIDESVAKALGPDEAEAPDFAEQPGLFEEESIAGPVLDAGEDLEAAVPPETPKEPDPSGAEEPADWDGDPSRVPAGWFADIDEDEVVPPPVETPETDWEEASEEGQWEGQAQWHAERPDVFDIEEPSQEPPAAVELSPEPEETAATPEGYEQWHDAVEAAIAPESRPDQPVDDATFEHEQPVVQDEPPATPDLPEGFESFPGTAETERFGRAGDASSPEIPPADDGYWGAEDAEWPRPSEAAGAGDDRDVEIDEQIYTAGGTVEHRDLADAIAEAGDDDTQWQAISAAMPGVETGVLGFEDVADLGHGDDYVAPIRSNLATRVATGLVLVALLFGSLLLAEVAFVGFVGLAVMLGLAEFYGSLRRRGYLPLTLFGLIGGAGTLAATWFHGPLAIASGVLLTSAVTFFFYAFSPTQRDALSNGGLTVLGIGWVVATIAFVIPIARAEDHVALVFTVVAVTAGADIGAFAFGRAWGRSALSPILSPNKTAEGLAGGVMMALLIGAVVGFFEMGPFDLRSGLALGGLVAVLAPLGDLSESMVKRSLGIKDMGSILPGHGGVLDRIDAFLFVIPAAWVFFRAIGFLG